MHKRQNAASSCSGTALGSMLHIAQQLAYYMPKVVTVRISSLKFKYVPVDQLSAVSSSVHQAVLAVKAVVQ
jgi:hypothetical protein